MNPKTCDQCGKVFSTKFCPECGRKYEDILISKPVTVTTYVHGSKEDGFDICGQYDIDPDSELGKRLIYINYEVKLIYEIVNDKPILNQVDAGDGRGLCVVIPIK